MFGKPALRSVLLFEMTDAMDHRSDRWAAVGQAVTQAVQATGTPLAQIAAKAGVSDKFIRALMAGEPRKYGPKAAAVGAVFGWAPNWLDLVLDGQSPPAVMSAADELWLHLGALAATIETEVADRKADIDDVERRHDERIAALQTDVIQLRRWMVAIAGRLGLVLDELDVDEPTSPAATPAAPTADPGRQ